ncbi:MAG: ammonium transporter [Desulfurococcales archaeon]|nr:ammonium transporter [Desulfurococcales archaeon]
MAELDGAATAWILASTSMVVLMTFGVAFFYGGLVRRKNVASMIALSLVSLFIVSIQWAVIGFSLSFAPSIGGVVGGLDYALLRGIGMEPLEGTSIPGVLYVAFQMAFAAITLAILTSPFAERARLTGFIAFGLLWTTLVYDPVAHWIWGGGGLHGLVERLTGATPIDFAGGLVVHTASGFSALAVALVIGPRLGFEESHIPPHSIPLTMIGGALLWFGWFGFNAGSALASDGVAGNALLVTHLAASAGAASWALASWSHGRPGSLGMISGAVAGLVAITPAAGFVGPIDSLVIGALAGFASYKALAWRLERGLDESLDAWAIHGVSGVLGSILTGVFAREGIGGVPGLLEGNPGLFAAQIVDAIVIIVYSFTVTLAIAKFVDRLVGLRVTPTEEYVGIDISQHGEEAYR